MNIANNILPALFSSSEIFVTPESEDLHDNSLGGNRKGIIVLYHDEQQEELLEFLQKILQAAKLDFKEDIWIKGITGQSSFSWTKLQKSIEISCFLSFGVPPRQLGLNISFQELSPTEFSGVTFLFSPTLGQLKNNKLTKGQLWTALQEIFLLNKE